MNPGLLEIITSADAARRDRAVDQWCAGRSVAELLAAVAELDAYRRRESNLYQRVRALFFITAIHRYHLPARPDFPRAGRTPYAGFRQLLERRFEEAITIFQQAQAEDGPSETLSSALAAAHHALAFQTLADQVRRTVRSTQGNAWMFRLGHPLDQPLRVRRELIAAIGEMLATQQLWVTQTEPQLVAMVLRCVREVVKGTDPQVLVRSSIGRALAEMSAAAEIRIKVHESHVADLRLEVPVVATQRRAKDVEYRELCMRFVNGYREYNVVQLAELAGRLRVLRGELAATSKFFGH